MSPPRDAVARGAKIGEEGTDFFPFRGSVMSAHSSVSRRGFLGTTAALPFLKPAPALGRVAPPATKTPQRACVVLFDGFGPEYYEASPMPTLKAWANSRLRTGAPD